VNVYIENYLEHLPKITRLLDTFEAPFYFSNPLFIVSLLGARSGASVQDMGGALLLDAAGEWCSLLPISDDREAFLNALRRLLMEGRPVMRVPRWAAESLLQSSTVGGWSNFVGYTPDLRDLPGRKYKRIRRILRQVERSGRTEVVQLTSDDAQEAARVADTWYIKRAPFLEKLYLRKENIWLFENIGWVLEHVPGSWGMGVKVDGRLEAVNLSCALSENMWCCHTERYSPGILSGINYLVFHAACSHKGADSFDWMNDGAAGVPLTPGGNNLATHKARIATRMLVPYEAWPVVSSPLPAR